jgi:hypothetical protein
MARGSISHIALTVSDLERSSVFYDKVLDFMGFKRVEVPEATQQAMKTRLKAWVGSGYSISIRPSKGQFARGLHRRLIQLAFLAPRIVEAVGTGHQPPELTTKALTERIELPLLWHEQERRVGIS